MLPGLGGTHFGCLDGVQFIRCVFVGGVDGGGMTFVWVDHCLDGRWLGYRVYEVGGGVVGGVNWW